MTSTTFLTRGGWLSILNIGLVLSVIILIKIGVDHDYIGLVMILLTPFLLPAFLLTGITGQNELVALLLLLPNAFAWGYGLSWLLSLMGYSVSHRDRQIRQCLCPKCGYDLRASRRSSRCPECGSFIPDELRDQSELAAVLEKMTRPRIEQDKSEIA